MKQKRFTALTITSCLLCLPFVNSIFGKHSEAAVNPVKFRINHYTTTTLKDAEADTIIADGVKLLKDKDGADDVSCTIDLSRDGAVTTFSTGNGVINSQKDYNDICALAGRVHMVNQINYCGGVTSPNIVGCSDTPGKCMILVRTDADLEGVLWMHEYGHNNGLNHRNDAMAVMNAVIDNTCKKINSSECTAYQSATTIAAEMRSQIQQPGRNVEEFVHKVYVHGVPYEEASKFSSGNVPQLLRMLSDPKERHYGSNIVVTLGAIGDPRAAKNLIDFLIAGTGNLSEDQFKAKSAVLMSLGYLVNKSRHRESLDFLLKSLNQSVWSQRIRWRAPFPTGAESQKTYLTTLAIWGLALSGTPEAGDALRALKRPSRTAAEAKMRARFAEVVDEALALHAKVARFGLTQVYRELQY